LQNLTFERKKKKGERLKNLKNKSVLRTSQNFTFRARKTRNNRERIEAKAEKRQRQNKERTKKK
jgi:hypothetical protein